MTKVSFDVTARTARLIGQENFATAEGAIIELVKNCYDADATTALVVFDIKYFDAPLKIERSEYEELSRISPIIRDSYKQEGNNFLLVKSESEEKDRDLADKILIALNSLNSIYIIDNGDGMDSEVIKDKWMKIGTANKLIEFKSAAGRIKTGAKGLGRFALDRLGKSSLMYTCKEGNPNGSEWSMDWSQFEDQKKILVSN